MTSKPELKSLLGFVTTLSEKEQFELSEKRDNAARMKKDQRKKKKDHNFSEFKKNGFKPKKNKNPLFPKQREDETRNDFEKRALQYLKLNEKNHLKFRKRKRKDRKFKSGLDENRESRRKKNPKVSSFEEDSCEILIQKC